MKLKSREKILFVFVLIAIAIWTFDRFYYVPQGSKILLVKEETKAADLKLMEYLQYAKGVETVEAEIARLEGDLKKLNELEAPGQRERSPADENHLPHSSGREDFSRGGEERDPGFSIQESLHSNGSPFNLYQTRGLSQGD
jgi:hypothetical protein